MDLAHPSSNFYRGSKSATFGVVWNFTQLWAARVWKCSKIIWCPDFRPSLVKLGPRTPQKALSVVTHPLKLHAKRAKSSIAQPWIIRFRSNCVQSLNARHPNYCKSSSSRNQSQGHGVTWRVQNNSYYAVQGHSRSPLLVVAVNENGKSIMRLSV